MHGYLPLIYLLPILLLLFLVFSRSRRAQQTQAAVLASVRPGVRVMTTSGLHATVISIEDDETAVLEIAPGVRTRWARPAIGEVFDDAAAGDAASSAVAATAATEPAAAVGDRIERDRIDTDRDDRTLT